MMNRLRVFLFPTFWLLLAAMLAGAPANVLAQEHEEHDIAEHEAAFHKNSLAVKIGVHYEEDANDPLVGLEYTRWMDHNFGWSIAYDYVDSEEVLRSQALAVLAVIKFAERWKFAVGPGVEYLDDDLLPPAAADDDREFLVRLGLAVEFELGDNGWFIEPAAEADLLKGEQKYFLGILVGKAF